MKMSDETNKKVQAYKDKLILEAESLVVKGFPKTIVQLNELLETKEFKNRDFAEIHQDLNILVPDPILVNNSHTISEEPPSKKLKLEKSLDGTNVMILPTGNVETNNNIAYIIGIVKPNIRKLVEDSNMIKMWISFMIPKIEDGNNFGVSIQEDTLAEVQSVESEAAAFFDQISRYFISRAKLVSKVAKYPHIEDYRRAVVELDEKEYLSLWLVLAEIRNRYCSLHDIVIKNLDKIKKPRPSNATESLY